MNDVFVPDELLGEWQGLEPGHRRAGLRADGARAIPVHRDAALRGGRRAGPEPPTRRRRHWAADRPARVAAAAVDLGGLQLAAGRTPVTAAALVKDLGTRFEQDVVDLVARGPGPPRSGGITGRRPGSARIVAARRDCRRRCSRCAAARNKVRCAGFVAEGPRGWERRLRRSSTNGQRAQRRAETTAAPPDDFDVTLSHASRRPGSSNSAQRRAGQTSRCSRYMLDRLARRPAHRPRRRGPTPARSTWLAAEADVRIPASGPLDRRTGPPYRAPTDRCMGVARDIWHGPTTRRFLLGTRTDDAEYVDAPAGHIRRTGRTSQRTRAAPSRSTWRIEDYNSTLGQEGSTSNCIQRHSTWARCVRG